MNGDFEEFNKRKYLTLVPTIETKEKIKKYEELCSKIRDLIRFMTMIEIWLWWYIWKLNLIQMTN